MSNDREQGLGNHHPTDEDLSAGTPGNRDQDARLAAELAGGVRTRCRGIKLLFVLCAILLPAGATLCAQQPPDAHTIAQLVDSHYNKLHSLRASFTESYEGLGMTRSESGKLLLLKPGRMRWDYSSPAGKVFLSDGKYAWFFSPGGAQVQRIPVKRLDDLRSPLSFLLGHTQFEKELTGLRLTQSPQRTLLLTGQPKGQTSRVQRVTLTVAPSNGAILEIEIDETDGAITRFVFTSEEPNVAVPESSFHFTPPAGVPVVDGLPPA